MLCIYTFVSTIYLSIYLNLKREQRVNMAPASYVCSRMLQGIKVSEEGGDSQSAGKHFPRMQPVDDKMTDHESVWNQLTLILQGKLI